MSKQCSDCRDGEQINDPGEIIELVIVRDPNGKMLKRSYMCEDHQTMYLDDGYTVASA